MEYIRFGNTGMKVSRICLGCMSYGGPTERWPWALDEETSRPFIKRALDLSWTFSKPVVTAPIIGATKPHHLDDAVAALSIQLTPDEIKHMEEAYAPHTVLGYS